MKTEITFAQVAHLYLRSEISFKTTYIPTNTVNEKLPMFSFWYNSLISVLEDKDSIVTPIFTPFENLIKPVKANKFVAELLEINEGDEYVMIEEINDLLLDGYLQDPKSMGRFLNSNTELKHPKELIAVERTFDIEELRYVTEIDRGFNVICYNTNKDFSARTLYIDGDNNSVTQALLIAAGYNVYQIKDCKYE